MPIKREVSIAIPVAQLVDPKTLQSMMALCAYSAARGIKIHHIGVTERCMIDDARNILAEAFLRTPTEWLFWMDSDMTFPPDTLVKLFDAAEKLDAKLLTGVYYQRLGMNYPCLWSRGEKTEKGEVTGEGDPRAKYNKYLASFAIIHPDKKEPFEVHSAGFGCVLSHRSTYEMMARPWFKMLPGTCSEDFYFFVNAKDLGFKLWAVPDIDLGHIGEAPIVTKKDFFRKATEKNIEIDALIKKVS